MKNIAEAYINQRISDILKESEASEVLKESHIPYNVPNTNLYVVGFGRDLNGNSTIIVATPNERNRSLQIGDVFNGKSVKYDYWNIESPESIQSINKALVDYVSRFEKGIRLKVNNTEEIKEAYGDKRDFKKIDIFVDGKYKASTTWAKSCAIAIEEYKKNNPGAENVKAYFSKKIGESQIKEETEQMTNLMKTLRTKLLASEYGNDPLYVAVINAKDYAEYNKKLSTLREIRGNTAVNNFLSFVNKTLKNLKESRLVSDSLKWLNEGHYDEEDILDEDLGLKYEKEFLDDHKNIGTDAYKGHAYFWNYEYRHYLRDATPNQRKQVHDAWLAAGLKLSGKSSKHMEIINSILKPINEDLEMKTYIVTVKHDNGKTKIRTTAKDEDSAKQMIMKAEGCPESAIISVEEVKAGSTDKQINRQMKWKMKEDVENFEDEEDIQDEPQDDDAFISDNTRGGLDASFGGKFLGNFREYDDAVIAIGDKMEKDQWWPNIWSVSDHGNMNLITDFQEEYKRAKEDKAQVEAEDAKEAELERDYEEDRYS